MHPHLDGSRTYMEGKTGSYKDTKCAAGKRHIYRPSGSGDTHETHRRVYLSQAC